MWLYLLISLIILLGYRTRKNLKGRPGSKGLPFVKDQLELWKNKKRGPLYAEEMFEKYGDTYFESSLLGSFLRSRDPEIAKFYLNDIETFVRRPEKLRASRSQTYFNALFGKGIFLADGELWEHQRHNSQPLFRKNSLDAMITTFHRYGKNVLELLGESAADGSVVDLQDIFNRYTMDSFGEIGFGVVFNSLSENNPFPLSFDAVQNMLIPLILNPYNWFVKNKVFFEHIDYCHDYIDSIIEKRTELSREELDTKNDLLSRFLYQNETVGYDNKFLRDLVMNFVIAGKDTTAQLLTWTCYNLALYPEYKKKLMEEIDGFEKDFTRTNINSLPYLDRFIHETLRLFPSVPRSTRRSVKDVVLPNGMTIYQGEGISVNIYNLHRNPKYWDDPETFDPDRWIVSPLKHPYQYLPFYGGPMVCIGKHLALAEAKTMTILLLQKYDFELVEDIEPQSNLIFRALNGVKVILSERKK